MKKYYLFIALAMVAAMTVSCKNNKKAEEAAEATEEVVEAAKTILADDVLATIDELAQTFADEAENINVTEIISSSLTDEEKLVKPDYLLEADQVNALVTKSQKVAALAILALERHVRLAYEMPTENTDEVLAHLTAELNHPVPADNPNNLTPTEKIRNTYEQCKKDGELSYFWRFALALQVEASYLISKNPDVFFRNLTEEQYHAFAKRFKAVTYAVKTLAEYDPEIKEGWEAFNDGGEIVTDLTKETIEYGKNHFIEKAAAKAARRANLLK